MFKVYNSCVLSSFLYACETWVTYQRHEKTGVIHQQCGHCILGFSWQIYMSNIDILKYSQFTCIEFLVLQYQLQYGGHVVRMKDDKTPKQLLHGKLAEGKRCILFKFA